jgi:hypothetical protein
MNAIEKFLIDSGYIIAGKFKNYLYATYKNNYLNIYITIKKSRNYNVEISEVTKDMVKNNFYPLKSCKKVIEILKNIRK